MKKQGNKVRFEWFRAQQH